MTVWIFPLFRQIYVIIKNIIILHILCFLNIMLPYRSVVSYSMYVKECLCKVQSCGTGGSPHVYADEQKYKGTHDLIWTGASCKLTFLQKSGLCVWTRDNAYYVKLPLPVR